MYTAKIITDGDTQVVVLPEEIRFTCDEVLVNRIGDVVVLFPPEKDWDILAQSLNDVSADFMEERDQGGAAEERESL